MNNTTSCIINFSIYAARLIESGYRFIRVESHSKRPIDLGWNKQQNFSGSEKQFSEHIAAGGNYGVKGDYEHIIIDLDRAELLPLLDQLPPTFTVRSGSGRGLHSYFLCKNEGPMRLLNPENSNENWGDIQAEGKQVIGPGCIHPDGGTYTIERDVPVATITLEDITRVFGAYIRKRRTISPEEVRRSYREHGNLFDSISLSDVGCFPTNPGMITASGEIQGGHPLHGSSTGQNFSINPRNNVWHCYRHGTGGGPLEWLAIAEGVISCEDAGPGCLRGDTFKRVLEIAREKGLRIPELKRERFTLPRILDDEPDEDDEDENDWGFNVQKTNGRIVTLEELPDKRPEHQTVLLDAPPRLGKTHHVISKWVARDSATANVITTSHSICGHHVRLFSEHKNKYSTAIHLEGKDRCCKQDDKTLACQDCPYYPYESEEENNYMEFKMFAKDYINQVKILTKDNCPRHICPYYLIKAAEPYADFVFTVSQNMNRLSDREHWVFDEDPSIGHFFAESAPLLEVTFHGHTISVTSILEEKWQYIQKYKTFLLGGKKTKGRKTILRVIEILEQIRALIPMENMSRSIKTSLLDELNAINTNIEVPDDISTYKLIETVKRFESAECLSPFLEALLYQYAPRRFVWTGDNPATLHIVADGARIIQSVPEGKITIIGNTRAELFIRALLERRPDYKVIRINTFPYYDWFVMCVLKDQTKKSGRKLMERILHQHNDHRDKTRRYPTLVLTGSTKDQARLHKIFGGIAHCSSDEDQEEQLWNHGSGAINIFYQNSVISRGIDVDFYTDIYIYSSDFANPYWQARLLVAKDTDDTVDQEFVSGILNLIIMDETTNSLLRISPVRQTNDGIPRVVYINEIDLWKVKPYVLDGIVRVDISEQMFDQVREITRKFAGNNVRMICGSGDDGESYRHGYIIRSERRNDVGKPDVDKLMKDVREVEDKKYSDWKKSHDIRDLDEIAESIRKFLKHLQAKDRKISEGSLITYITKHSPKHKKKVYAAENIARVLQDMVKSGEVMRDFGDSGEAMGVKSKVCLRERWERPNIGNVEQFDF